MKSTVEVGRQGEALARAYLESMGFEILEQNWRSGHQEIDLIASKENVLHIVEVKYRKTDRFGPPEAAVSRQKIKLLMRAAAAYLAQNPWTHIQIDILAIRVQHPDTEYHWIEDVSL